MVAVSLLFHYAKFVLFLGGDEFALGWITGLGMVGALLARALQGMAIDRYGPGRIWKYSLILLVISLVGHLMVGRIDGPGIYLARVLFCTSIAGAFGGSITYVSLRAPTGRTAEMVGMLGTSGFVGMAVGPAFGDWLMDVPQLSRWHLDRMFLVSAGMVCISLVFALIATRSELPVSRRKLPRIGGVLRKYHPGALLLVGMAMGIGIGLPHTFLRPYVDHLGFDRIRLFFWVYAGTAMAVRFSTRRLTDQWGVRPMIHWGLGCLAATMLLFTIVRHEWMLILPAAVGGTAHAFLFPAVVAGTGHAFPSHYRGLATTLILAMFDLGNLLGQPTIGGILEVGRYLGLPAYPLMFVGVSLLLIGTNLIYAWSFHREKILETAPVRTDVREPASASHERATETVAP